MLSELYHMWDGHLRLIRAEKNRIELTFYQVLPVHSGTYRAGPTNYKLENFNVYKMLKMSFMEPAQTEWASPIFFTPQKTGSLFFVDNRKFNAATVHY